jgi:transcriptional regulator with XRE-family HTH domain
MPTDDLPDWVLRHRWTVGERLRAIRIERQLTQEQLADIVGVDSKTVSRAENGVYNISLDLVARLAHGLEVPSWRFFRDE